MPGWLTFCASVSFHRYNPMFSLAISIPYNRDKEMYDISLVFNTEPGNRVIINCVLCIGRKGVAATLLKSPSVLSHWPIVTWADVERYCPDAVFNGQTDNAEFRVLQHFNALVNYCDTNDLMLFYIYASAYLLRCTNVIDTRNILRLIKPVTSLHNYAVVFSEVFTETLKISR